MIIRIRPLKSVLLIRPVLPKCLDWIIDHEEQDFTAIPENHVHIMDESIRRTIPSEFVEVVKE